MLKKTIIILATLTLSTWCLTSFAITVTIVGVNKEQEKNIRSQLSLIPKSKNKANPLTTQQIRQLHARAEKEILTALQPYGYYHAKVQGILTDTQATYQITLGKPTLVEKINTRLTGPGAYNPKLSRIFRGFELKPGHILNHGLYEKDKTEALAKAIQHGYLHAYYSEHQVVVDLSRYKANIDLVMNTGPLFTLGPVDFKTDYFCPQFLNRFVPYTIGDFYTPEQVLELENRLSASHYFSRVEVVPLIPIELTGDPNVPNTVVPIQVNLTKVKANQYLFGLGYDTNTNARLRLGWDRLYLNNRGHRLTTNAKLSEVDKEVRSDYIIPGCDPLNDEYRITAMYADDEFKDKPSTSYSIGVSETHKVKDWHRTLTLRYLFEQFKDSDLVEEYSHFLLPSIDFVKVKTNGRHAPSIATLAEQPKNGYRLTVSARGGINALLSDKSFAQTNMEYKWLKQLTPRDTIIARTELGLTLPESLEDLPLSIRFFAGGDQSIRGFGYRSLPSELDNQGNLRPVGGSYLAVGSIEYNRVIKGPVSFATFIDAGNAFNHISDLKTDCQVGAGVGIKWATPLGPIRVYAAKPLTHGAPKNDWRVHIIFGPEL